MLNYTIKKSKIMFHCESTLDKLYIIGSFTNWKINENYKMKKKDNSFFLEINIENVDKIGNSGYPEYYFGNEDMKLPFDEQYPQGYFFNNQADMNPNYLIHFSPLSEIEAKSVYKLHNKSYTIKSSVHDFDNSFELSNFRKVQGGSLAKDILYRSYHPFIPSRGHNNQLKDIEIIRQDFIKHFLEKYSIKNIINLSETAAKLDDLLNNNNLQYYKTLYLEKKILCAPMSYETVYFMSNKNEKFNEEEFGFQDGIKKIIEFISENHGPFLVHCRLGSDRTGVIIAFLQLFMNCTKEEIKDNYLLTNNLGIGEYRSFNLLESSLKNAFGDNCFKKRNLNEYLKSIGLSDEKIEAAFKNLSCKK